MQLLDKRGKLKGVVSLGIVLSKLMTYRFARPIMVLGTRIQNIALGIPGEAQELNFSNREINRIKESIECIVEDIARREKLQKTAEYMSYHDSMTGIYNRRYFDEVMKQMDEHDSYPFCIICCDINGLKLVNDVFGHTVGDQLICRVAEGLKKGFRHESICGAVVSVSIGYSVKKDSNSDIAECLCVADKMMYEEKIVKSAEMKRKTVQNILQTARKERLLMPLALQEQQLLEKISARFWDGSGELAGLSGENIPLSSRIIAVVDEYSRGRYKKAALQEHRAWFDPKIVEEIISVEVYF